MLRNRLWLATLILALVLPAFAAPADEKKGLEETSAQKVRLKLIAIEIAQLTDHYAGLVKRELGLRDGIRACGKSGDGRLDEYQQALKDTLSDLEETKIKLVDLEIEKAKLSEQLGKKASEDAAAESVERLNRTLDTILQRLDRMDKRLEKLEGQKR